MRTGQLLGIGALAAAAQAGQAQSQNPPGAMTAEDIVVTARLREENVQDVPISLAVLDQQTIERQRIDSLDRLSLVVPSLSASDPFGRNNPSVSIRGIGLAGIGDELPVGIFIDGIYVAGRSSANLLITDLERIEVARGPQSALFGRNSFAGAINFVTRRPGDRFEAYVEGTAGSSDRYELRAGLSAPLIAGQLGLHVGLIHRDWGGFYENTNPDGPPLNRQRTTAGNIVLAANPTDRFDATLRLTLSSDRDSTAAAFLVPANVGLTISNGGSLGFFSGTAPVRPPAGTVCCAASDGVRGFERDTIRIAFTMNHDLSETLRLTSLTGYTYETQLYDQDVDYLADKLFTFGNFIDRDDISQELRLSHDDGKFRALGGLFYYQFNNRFQNYSYAQFFLPPALRSDDPARTNGPFVSDTRTRAFAAFGSVGASLGPVNLSADIRWNRETKRFAYFRGAALIPDPVRERTWESWIPRFTADWRPADEVMLYASAAKGFKTGGFNDQPNLFEAERIYDPETNWTYEIGTRLTLADNRLFLNLTGFWIDWTDQQVVTVSAAGIANNSFIGNAARSTSKGFELDMTARPTDRLILTGAVALADARFDSFIDPALAGPDITTGRIVPIPGLTLAQLPNGVFGADVSGNALPRSSKWQAAASAQYTFPVDALGADGLYVRGDWQYRSRQCAEPSNLACVGDQNRANLRIGLEVGRFALSAWVDNVFDNRTPPVIIRFSDFNSFFTPPVGRLNRAFQVTPADGRTWGATLRISFGT